MDGHVNFPFLKIVKASAGSGKTYYLTKTYVEYLLSDSIKHNDLKNILAITFSNNAAIEIKERVLKWLKDIYFGKEDALKEFNNSAPSTEELKRKAETLIEKILNNYSEFQVRTIDSFMTKIFKAEALRFGYPGDFEIIMKSENFIRRAFEVFLGKFSHSSPEIETLLRLIDIIEENLNSEATYIWNPSKKIFQELKNLYVRLSNSQEDLIFNSIDKVRRYFLLFEKAKENVKKKAIEFEKLIENKNRDFKGIYKNIPEALEKIKRDDFSRLPSTKFNQNPVSKPCPEIEKSWNDLKKAVAEYLEFYSKTYYLPYIIIFSFFNNLLTTLKINEQKLFIEDVNKKIAEKISTLIIPEVYEKIGARIYHYLIDEFQDTSPIQWLNLKVLISNSLASEGSLLIVGDTKQAIYGFRGADYTIMAGLIKEAKSPKEIPSVKEYKVERLPMNYRSGEKIIDFVKKFFKEDLRTYLREFSSNREYWAEDEIPEPLILSGLWECEQEVKDELKNIGYVNIELVEYNSDEDRDYKQKEAIVSTINKLKDQYGFSYSEIAVLAFKNPTIKQISTWLNEAGLEFISFSSLDIRNRVVISELVHLLKFLDSPIDNFSLSLFLLGDIASKSFSQEFSDWKIRAERLIMEREINRPLYKAFMEQYPQLWIKYFDNLLKKVGYLPLYDLVTEIFSNFKLFEIFPEEESALVKFLEIVLFFEEESGGLRSFIEFYETSGDEDETFWDTSKPNLRNSITLMTVHKSKGLEFPAVILWMDIDASRNEGPLIHEGDLIKIPKKEILENIFLESMRKLRKNSLSKLYSDDLNKIYVALTRTKEVLHIIISCKSPEKDTDKPCFGKGSSHINEATKCLLNIDHESESIYIRKTPKQEESKPKTVELNHFPKESIYEPPHFAEQNVDTEELKRGDFFHKLIASFSSISLEKGKKWKDDVILKAQKLKFDLKVDIDTEEILKLIEKILKNNRLAEFFNPNYEKTIYIEKEIVDNRGSIYRVDRILVDDNRVSILEFKFGSKPEIEKATEQVKRYTELLSHIYPDMKIEGLIYLAHDNRLIEI